MKNKKKWIIALIIVIILLLLFVLYLLFGRTRSFTVTFDTDGGTEITNVKISNGEIFKLPDVPTKEGYIFIGWVNEEEKLITEGTKFTSDTKLKAKWIKNDVETVDVIFDKDESTKTDNITMEKDNKILLPVNPTNEGYIFGGWINEEGKVIGKDTIISSNTKLKAYWIKNDAKTYTIIFDTDGGSNIDSIKVESNKTILLPVNPKKEGYVFSGWIDEGGNAITKDILVDKDMKLKATWKEPYTCPTDCTPIENGSKCTKEVTTDMVSTSFCPSGYTMNNGTCTGSKYHANNGSNGWECNSSSDYMYSEEDGTGGAFMWCVKIASVTSSQGCPSGYTKSGDTCKKIEIIDCTVNQESM